MDLLTAAKGDYLELAKKLLKEDVNAKNEYGHTALMTAAGHGLIEMVHALLAVGADVNAKNNAGWTTLMKAAQNGHIKMIRTLLDAGADVNAKNNADSTALTLAAYWRHSEVAHKLVVAGADIHRLVERCYDTQLIQRLTAEHSWQKRRHLLILRKSLRKGEDVFDETGGFLNE